jgi:hypothetical protein
LRFTAYTVQQIMDLVSQVPTGRVKSLVAIFASVCHYRADRPPPVLDTAIDPSVRRFLRFALLPTNFLDTENLVGRSTIIANRVLQNS